MWKRSGQFAQNLNNTVTLRYCVLQGNLAYSTAKLPQVGCSYVARDQCSDFDPPTCCERVTGVENGGMVLGASVVLMILSLMTAIVG